MFSAYCADLSKYLLSSVCIVDDEIRTCANPIIGIGDGVIKGHLVEGVKVPSLTTAMAVTFLVAIIATKGDELVDGILLIVRLNGDRCTHIVVDHIVTFTVVLRDDEVIHGADV